MKFAQLIESILSAIGISTPARAPVLVPALRRRHPARQRRSARRN